MNKGKRVAIGRKLSSNTKKANFITLKSGKKEEMIFTVIAAGDVETETFLSTEIQPRIHSELDQKKIAKLAKSMKRHQFVPCFGFRDENNKICIFDGSRRRAAAILEDLPLNIWVITSPVSVEEAKWLAQEMQANTESLNRRENGKMFIEWNDSPSSISLRDIAEESGFSLGYVSNAITIARVNSDLVNLILSDIEYTESDLTLSNYKTLLEIQNSIVEGEGGKPLKSFEETMKSLDTLVKRIACLRKHFLSKTKPSKQETELLLSVNKNKFIRKTVKNKDKIVYEFSRIDKELQEKFETIIEEYSREQQS